MLQQHFPPSLTLLNIMDQLMSNIYDALFNIVLCQRLNPICHLTEQALPLQGGGMGWG